MARRLKIPKEVAHVLLRETRHGLAEAPKLVAYRHIDDVDDCDAWLVVYDTAPRPGYQDDESVWWERRFTVVVNGHQAYGGIVKNYSDWA